MANYISIASLLACRRRGNTPDPFRILILNMLGSDVVGKNYKMSVPTALEKILQNYKKPSRLI
jgi:hypothetical protein